MVSGVSGQEKQYLTETQLNITYHAIVAKRDQAISDVGRTMWSLVAMMAAQ